MKKTLLFLLLLALPVMTMAQSDIGFYGVGAKLGYIMPEGDIENTLGFGLNADLGSITPDIALEAYVDYWAKKYDEDSGFYGSSWETTLSLFSIGAVAKYYFETSGDFEPYAGAGLGMNFVKYKTEWEGHEESTSDSDLGIILLGGAKKELSPTMDGFAEIKYVMADGDYLGIFVGVMYKLGN